MQLVLVQSKQAIRHPPVRKRSTLMSAAPPVMPTSAAVPAVEVEGLLGDFLKLGKFTSQLARGSNTSLGSGGR